MRALVVGHGHMGRIHARVLTDLGFDVTTADPSVEAGADVLTVEEWRWDAAAVATPVQHLVPYAIGLLRAGTPTLVEKPVSVAVADVERLSACQRLSQTPCAVGFVERFNPRVIDLKRHLEQHLQPGGVVFTRFNDRPSFNVALDLALHDIDLAHHLGFDPRACIFRTRAGTDRRVRRIDLSGYGAVDLMDHQSSPLHGLWRAFLAGGDYPTLVDAIAAHEALAALGVRELAA